MRLQPLHRDELFDIAKRGSATAIAVILFWGYTAPATFLDKPEDQPLISRYGIAMTTIVVAGCFWSSYRNLLTPNLSENDRKLGFVLFWTIGSLCCECIWWIFMSDRHASMFASARSLLPPLQGLSRNLLENDKTAWVESFSKITTMHYLHWAVENDKTAWVESFSKITTMHYLHWSVELNLRLCALILYRRARSDLEYREALFYFAALGSFQCYGFFQSACIFLSPHKNWIVGRWPEPGNVLDECIIWSIRIFPILGSGICARFSYLLLFGRGEGQTRPRHEEESKTD